MYAAVENMAVNKLKVSQYSQLPNEPFVPLSNVKAAI
jgi:hypothetical protein